MTDALWNHDEPISELDVFVPRWIDQDITGTTLASIIQGGCASGAYMPAVTYHEANLTMFEHGDEVIEFITDAFGTLPQPSEDTPQTWGGMACFYLSAAVELWASSVEEEVTESIAEALSEE